MKADIPSPSIDKVQSYLNKWDSLENYVMQESSLKKLFTATYPTNESMDDVLIKVCALNDFYSTKIFSPFKMAKHIVDLKIDERLTNSDYSLVNEIALVKMNDSKTINFYSFATKYCSHHKPEEYPIYDSYVEKVLIHFKRVGRFAKFTKEELKNYIRYRNILIEFRRSYGLEKFNLKQLDKYLWQLGKDYFYNIYNY
jgi:hypothetical protein